MKVYEFNGSTWEQKGSEMRGLEIGDHFGSRISMNSAGNRIAAADLTVSATAYDWDGNDWYVSGGWITGGSTDTGLEFDISLSATGKELAFGDVTTMNNLGYHGTTRIYQLDGEVGLTQNTLETTFQLFPNPTNAAINIRANAPSSELFVQLIDPMGNILEEKRFHHVTQLDINASSGIYFVRIVSNDGEPQLFRVVKI